MSPILNLKVNVAEIVGELWCSSLVKWFVTRESYWWNTEARFIDTVIDWDFKPLLANKPVGTIVRSTMQLADRSNIQ